MYCPKCGNQAIRNKGNSPNGGELIVEEAFGRDCEVYDEDITEYECCAANSCGAIFYMKIDGME
jgi:hypothetical protein